MRAVVFAFQCLRIPTSLGYLLLSVILGPHAVGPMINVPEFKTLAEFGLVFLLFTIVVELFIAAITRFAPRGTWAGRGWALRRWPLLQWSSLFVSG